MFEQLRSAIDALLDAATPEASGRDAARLMQDAVVEARASVTEMRAQIAETKRRLEIERGHLEDAKRRGKLAADIEDRETVEIAKEFAAKHQDRISVLASKLEAQQAEIALAERELAQMREELKQVRHQALGADAAARVELAWRDIEGAGGVRPNLDPKDDLLRYQMDAAAKEAVAAEQLRKLKKKMGR